MDAALAFILMTMVIGSPFILTDMIAGLIETYERRK
jgi:hypothetical protein